MGNVVTGEDYKKAVQKYEEKYYDDDGKVDRKAVKEDLADWLTKQGYSVEKTKDKKIVFYDGTNKQKINTDAEYD